MYTPDEQQPVVWCWLKPRKWWQHEKESARPPHKQACLAGRWRALKGPRPGGPRASHPFSLFPYGPAYSFNILISVLFLRLVGLLSYGPCMAYSCYFMLFRMALVPLLPHNPWSLPQASLIGPKLGLAGGISRWAKLGPINSLIITR